MMCQNRFLDSAALKRVYVLGANPLTYSHTHVALTPGAIFKQSFIQLWLNGCTTHQF